MDDRSAIPLPLLKLTTLAGQTGEIGFIKLEFPADDSFQESREVELALSYMQVRAFSSAMADLAGRMQAKVVPQGSA